MAHAQEIQEKTIAKLDIREDSETLIEDYMLVSSHFINAAMHKLGTLKEDRDIKHNHLFGFVRREKSLRESSEEVADLIQQIDQLRPSYVYGKGENGDTAEKAKDAFDKIKQICSKIIENERVDTKRVKY